MRSVCADEPRHNLPIVIIIIIIIPTSSELRSQAQIKTAQCSLPVHIYTIHYVELKDNSWSGERACARLSCPKWNPNESECLFNYRANVMKWDGRGRCTVFIALYMIGRRLMLCSLCAGMRLWRDSSKPIINSTSKMKKNRQKTHAMNRQQHALHVHLAEQACTRTIRYDGEMEVYSDGGKRF